MYLLTIREIGNSWAGRAPISSRHATEAEARAALVDYVRLNWAAEMEGAPPDDLDVLVAQYFAAVPEAYDVAALTEERAKPEEAYGH